MFKNDLYYTLKVKKYYKQHMYLYEHLFKVIKLKKAALVAFRNTITNKSIRTLGTSSFLASCYIIQVILVVFELRIYII